jgi:tetratricopeptide (TPR) repeat protein
MAKQKLEKRLQPQKKSSVPKEAKTERWYSLIIFCFAFALYSNSIFNGYNLDDELVTQNHRLTSKGITAIPEIFKSAYYEDKAGYKYEYRPVVLASFAIEHTLFGDNSQISHLINVLLYALLCVLLFIVLKQLLHCFNPLLPFIIGLLFISHPIHTEVVASIKNRDEILALGFALLSLFCAVSFAETKKFLYLILIPFLLLAGILSKSTTLVFAGLIPLSLIMLTNIKLGHLLLVTLAVAVPSSMYSRLYSITEQILFAASLFISVALLYCLKRLQWTSGNWFTKAIDEEKKSAAAKPPTSILTLVLGFIQSKKGLLSIAIVLVACISSFSGFYLGNAWAIAPLALLTLAYVVVSYELKAILMTAISFTTLFSLAQIQDNTGLLECGLVIFLVSHIISDDKTLKAVAVFNYLMYVAVAIIFIHSWFFLLILLFASHIDKKLKPVTIIAILFSIVYASKHVFNIFSGNKTLRLGYCSMPLLYVFYFLWKSKQQLLLKLSSLSIPLLLILYFVFSPPPQNREALGTLKAAYYKAKQIKAADATPIQTLRPLKYIEYPLESSDPFSLKFGTSMIILGRYLKLIFVPYPMSFYYGYAYVLPTPFLQAIPILTLIFHLVLLGTALYWIRKDSLISFSILFYLAAIVVFSNLFIPIPGLMGDRFLLIPSIGFCIFITVVFSKYFKQNFTGVKLRFGSLVPGFKITLSVTLLLYSLITFSRNLDWKDRITLFRNDIKSVDNSAQAQNLLGLHLFIESNKETDQQKQKLMREEAVVHLRRAVEIYPPFLNASFDLARVYEALQQTDSAYVLFERTRLIDSSFAAPCFSMAIIQQNKGNYANAISLYETFLSKYPHQMEAYANLSYAYFMQGKYDSSIAINKRALKFSPNSFEPMVNIGKTYLRLNSADSALYYFELARRLKPGDPTIQNLLNQLNR